MITVVCSTNRKDAVSQTVANIYVEILKSHQVAHQFINLGDLPADFIFSALYENSGKNEVFNKLKNKIPDELQESVFQIFNDLAVLKSEDFA